MKKLTILLITFLGIYLIYSFYDVKRINYVSITDDIINNYNEYLANNSILHSFNNYFTSSSILKLYQNIKNNQTIKINDNIFYLKKVLRESDVLVISVGMEELASKFKKYDMDSNYAFFDYMFLDISRLIKEIKKYVYGRIIFIGYYNPFNYYDSHIDRFFYDIDIKLSKLMIDNDIVYIDLYELVKGNNYKENSNIYLNSIGNKKIAGMVKFYLS